MAHWLNVSNVTFILFFNGSPQSITGKLVHLDASGATILNAADGLYYGYGVGVIQQAHL